MKRLLWSGNKLLGQYRGDHKRSKERGGLSWGNKKCFRKKTSKRLQKRAFHFLSPYLVETKRHPQLHKVPLLLVPALVPAGEEDPGLPHGLSL